MRTHYQGHDEVYQRRRASGQAGWDSAEVTTEVAAQFRRLLEHEAIPRSGRVLELGCGAGNHSVHFARMGYQVTGIDIAPSAIDWARQRAAEQDLDIDFVLGNVVTMEAIESSGFDMVIDSHCLHCIIGQDRARLLTRIRSFLGLGGIFVVNTMCQNARTVKLEGFDPKTGLTCHGDIATRFIGTQAQLESELEGAGFELIESRREVDGECADDLLIIGRVDQRVAGRGEE